MTGVKCVFHVILMDFQRFLLISLVLLTAASQGVLGDHKGNARKTN